MILDDVRRAIADIRYKPGVEVELAPVVGRLFDPEAGRLRLILKLPVEGGVKVHSKEMPPAAHIRDRLDLLRLVRVALREAEGYESDQMLGIGEEFPFRK